MIDHLYFFPKENYPVIPRNLRTHQSKLLFACLENKQI